MADLTTLLSKFLTNLWAGNITSAVTSLVMRTSTTADDTLKIQAYDVDGAGYTSLVTATAGNTPTLETVAPLYLGGATTSGIKLDVAANQLIVYRGNGANTVYTQSSNFIASDASITPATGTGLTPGTAVIRQTVYAVTVTKDAFVAAATTGDVTIATLPAKTFITHVIADVTQAFALAASTLAMTLGSAAGGNQYLVSFNAGGTGQFGDAAAELGASLAPASAPTLIGALGSWSTTSPVSLRLTSNNANLGNGAATSLTTGSVTIYLTTVKMP
jgi:hypothetical protein